MPGGGDCILFPGEAGAARGNGKGEPHGQGPPLLTDVKELKRVRRSGEAGAWVTLGRRSGAAPHHLPPELRIRLWWLHAAVGPLRGSPAALAPHKDEAALPKATGTRRSRWPRRPAAAAGVALSAPAAVERASLPNSQAGEASSNLWGGRRTAPNLTAGQAIGWGVDLSPPPLRVWGAAWFRSVEEILASSSSAAPRFSGAVWPCSRLSGAEE